MNNAFYDLHDIDTELYLDRITRCFQGEFEMVVENANINQIYLGCK